MEFTTGLIELSTRHLASGTARLSGAFVTFLGLGFGVALGSQLGGATGAWLVDHGVQWTPTLPSLPAGAAYAGVVLAACCFAVLLHATWRDTPWIVLAATAAFVTTQAASPVLGDELAAFLGALVVSAGSTLLARLRDTTPLTTITPGLLILVPGSIGLRSITSLQSREVVGGVAAAFSVALIGISLAAGLLAGRALTAALLQRRRPAGAELTRTAEWSVSRNWR